MPSAFRSHGRCAVRLSSASRRLTRPPSTTTGCGRRRHSRRDHRPRRQGRGRCASIQRWARASMPRRSASTQRSEGQFAPSCRWRTKKMPAGKTGGHCSVDRIGMTYSPGPLQAMICSVGPGVQSGIMMLTGHSGSSEGSAAAASFALPSSVVLAHAFGLDEHGHPVRLLAVEDLDGEGHAGGTDRAGLVTATPVSPRPC